MKTTNIRELKHATSTVLGWVAEGETVEITRRNQVVEIIIPPTPSKIRKAAMPDFYERLQELFHDQKRPMTGTEIISYARGER
jgi:antitoxin (DNA-binding transcriptional repressor) of toxin-antitoxin stability system